MSPLLATFSAYWEPLGPPVWLFLGLGLVAAWLVSQFSSLSARMRYRVLLALPAIMAVGCLFTRWIQSRSYSFLGRCYFYKFYYAELDTAFIVCFAFGVAFTLDSLRVRERSNRVVGWSFVPVYIWLLLAALRYIHSGLFASHDVA